MKLIFVTLLAVSYNILLMIYLSFLIRKLCGWFDIDILIGISQYKIIVFLFILGFLKIALFPKAKEKEFSIKKMLIGVFGAMLGITLFSLTAYLASILF